ncbi:MAG: hypothetical protein PWQ63_721 [Methanolobus sp.]|nr:hypothetical protein [Methanolobus sp.]
MDPYICPEALDRESRYYSTKMENLNRLDHHYDSRSEALKAYPVKMIVQTTDACNLSCVFCQIPKENKGSHMQKECFDSVVEEVFPTLIEMHPSNIGEPLMWPLFGYMCERMEEYGVLLDLTTNGTLLDGKNLDSIERIARDVKISFDGAEKSTFESIRNGASFEKVCDNVHQLVDLIGHKGHRCVSLQMTLMRSNFRELPDLIRLADSLGANKVKAYHLFSFYPELDKESLMLHMQDYEIILKQSMQVGKELGIDLELAEPPLKFDDDFQLNSKVCHLPWYESWIDIDGSVYPCHSNSDLDIGNICKSKFTDIWNGQFYRDIRNAIRKGEPVWNCKGCGMLYEKDEEHQRVPYDPENFLSQNYRKNKTKLSGIRWSGRMKQFELNRGWNK